MDQKFSHFQYVFWFKTLPSWNNCCLESVVMVLLLYWSKTTVSCYLENNIICCSCEPFNDFFFEGLYLYIVSLVDTKAATWREKHFKTVWNASNASMQVSISLFGKTVYTSQIVALCLLLLCTFEHQELNVPTFTQGLIILNCGKHCSL